MLLRENEALIKAIHSAEFLSGDLYDLYRCKDSKISKNLRARMHQDARKMALTLKAFQEANRDSK